TNTKIVTWLRKHNYVRNVVAYDHEQTPVMTRLSAKVDEEEEKLYDLEIHAGGNKKDLTGWLNGKKVTVVGTGRRIVRIKNPGTRIMSQIRSHPEVSRIEEYITPEFYNDRARVLMSIDYCYKDKVEPFEYEGEGQIIAVADSGIDENHPDLRNRLIKAYARGRKNDYSDPHGHGTHVAGSVLGDGSASGGKYKGVSPKARLVFQSLMDARGSMSGLPVDLSELFEEAYATGARIHNNSWGAETHSYYTSNSIEVDDYIAERRDMLLVFAAGNEGSSNDPVNVKPGFTDLLSIASPGSGKNVLTVGASRSDRTEGGFSTFSYKDKYRPTFPDPPIGDELISGNKEGMAAFSSRGPCTDRRIKPDLVAPGTDIISARSSEGKAKHYWGVLDKHYGYMGGTSMACPLVAGCAAMVREYYTKKEDHKNPSAALIKATLINGTRKLTGPDATEGYDGIPNYHQGFGCVDMKNTIPNEQQPDLSLLYVDSDNEKMKLTRTGKYFRWLVDVNGGLPLRVCLAYTDLPGSGLQNIVNLMILYQPANGKKIKKVGNQAFNEQPGNFKGPDQLNNVEIARIDDPAPGKCLIQVHASNIRNSQDFALVVTGNLSGDLFRR
ncbi:MAG: S8 family serine peptidase, partial [Cyclobacteriaceae bacterium]